MRQPPRTTRGRILNVDLDAFSAEPLNRRIYLSIRRDIVGGLLPPGAHLPSTRQLALDLRVSRGTVIVAYEQLRGEGYLEADAGGGTRVTASVPDFCVRARDEIRFPDSTSATPRAARRAERLVAEMDDLPIDLRGAAPRAFRSTSPAIDVFPIDIWTRIASRQWRRATTRDLSYGDPMGYLPLRQTIAEYVRATRGIKCETGQILVVAGAQQGMDIAARALLDPGDAAWMEDPGYFGIRGALLSAGAHVVPVGVDNEGIDVGEGRRLAPDARMAFVTPSHQMPLCVPLSAGRRAQLFEWADESGAWIFEDDYNCDFQYTTQPVAAMHAADRSARVIYCGTFNKSLFPGLRVGFVVLPERVVAECRAVRFFSDIQPSYIDQATLAEFIAEGHYERHIRRLRSIYQGRRELLIDGLRGCARWLTPTRYDSGRELTVWLDPSLDDVVVSRAAERVGLTVMPLSPWGVAHAIAPALRLGYSGIDERDITTGVEQLARVLDAVGQATDGPRRHAS